MTSVLLLHNPHDCAIQYHLPLAFPCLMPAAMGSLALPLDTETQLCVHLFKFSNARSRFRVE